MAWTWINVIVQTIAGILGGNAAASAVHEHRFGWIGHTVAGAIGGLLSGLFLQTLAATVVTGSGSLNQPTAVDSFVIQALTGLAAGGCVMLIAGLVKHIFGRT